MVAGQIGKGADDVLTNLGLGPPWSEGIGHRRLQGADVVECQFLHQDSY
jgi:hypothetical protein